MILLDTSILIDYSRKTDKENARMFMLKSQEHTFVISSITEYEIYSGVSASKYGFWEELLEDVEIIAFDKVIARAAVIINNLLKAKSKQIDIADLFIAATAVSNNLPFATLNRKHFERIYFLDIMD